MDELNCTLCDKKNLSRKEAIKHVFKEHLNYIPWTCNDCNYNAYVISDKLLHENENLHNMIQTDKYTSNFRIFSIIYCDMRYVKKFGEENLKKCRILRPSIEMDYDDNVCNDNTVKNNIVDSEIFNDCIKNMECNNVGKNKTILIDQNDVQRNMEVSKNIDNEHLNLKDKIISEDSDNNISKNTEITTENSIENVLVCSNISSHEENNETNTENKYLSKNTKNNDNDERNNMCKTNTHKSPDTLTKKRGFREKIIYDKDFVDNGTCLDSHERPNKRLKCSYNVLKPTLSTNKYILEYAFILDGDEISKLLPSSHITHCNVCKKEIKNHYDIVHHIRYYHNSSQEYKSPILSCSVKRCGEGFDDISDLRKHVKDYHNISTFVNNIDVHEKRREKYVYVNISANSLLKYEQLFIDCFPNLILRYCGEPLQKIKDVQLFLSYSSEKCDYLSSEYFYKKANGKDIIYCCICKKKVPVEKYLIRHVIENHMNRIDKNYNILACQECKEPKYYDMDDLEKHWERKHIDIGPFFNNYHIKFDKSPMQYTCVASIMSKDDLKIYEEVFEQAYPELKIDT